MNPDLQKERQNATIDLDRMKLYLGELIYFSKQNYYLALKYRDELVKKIKPISEENFFNLDRDDKYKMIFKKSLELIDFSTENKINEEFMSVYMIGSVIGPEKFLFNLQYTMFRDAIEVWSTPEQKAYWTAFLNENTVFGSYVQTELGHGTYLRGLETTATYDKKTHEFVLDSPTLTSTKYWPGASGKSCNFAIVMAKLIIDGKEHGIHAFIVQLRSLENHRVVPGLEVGDMGKKFGFDATDNGYLRFNKLKIPRMNMLMQFATVTPDGKFVRTGSEVLMYSAMLLMRGTLSLLGPFYLSISTTIAIRYSSVRRQTVNAEGVEQQVINYQTQQYRIFPALASTYAMTFTGYTIRKMLIKIQNETNRFKDIDMIELGKLHALTSGLKAVVFGDCLRFAQSNRLCCGGHGYSASSGLTQIIQEADAGCSYEGDNVVLLLQTARYLLKCTQKGVQPHLEPPNIERIKSSFHLWKHFERYFNVFYRLFDEQSNEITQKLYKLVKEDGMAELDGWNSCSQQLISFARVFIDIFIINCNLLCVYENPDRMNQNALAELLELYLLYEICEIYSGDILRLKVVDPETLNEFKERLFKLLPIIRVNAVALVDSFDMLDSNLCSSLGAYDGNVYERLLDFSRKSLFNLKEVHDVYELYLKPYALKNKHKARL